MKRKWWTSLLLAAFVGLSGQRADAMRTPLADVRASITQPHQLTAATAASDLPADVPNQVRDASTWIVESIIPLGTTADGQPLALISLLVPLSSLDELAPASTRAGPYAAPKTHTRVFCIVQPPLGLATEEWFDKTYTYDITTQAVSTEWNQPSLDIDGRFKDYNAFSRYSVPRTAPSSRTSRRVSESWIQFDIVHAFSPTSAAMLRHRPLTGTTQGDLELARQQVHLRKRVLQAGTVSSSLAMYGPVMHEVPAALTLAKGVYDTGGAYVFIKAVEPVLLKVASGSGLGYSILRALGGIDYCPYPNLTWTGPKSWNQFLHVNKLSAESAKVPYRVMTRLYAPESLKGILLRPSFFERFFLGRDNPLYVGSHGLLQPRSLNGCFLSPNSQRGLTYSPFSQIITGFAEGYSSAQTGGSCSPSATGGCQGQTAKIENSYSDEATEQSRNR